MPNIPIERAVTDLLTRTVTRISSPEKVPRQSRPFSRWDG